MELIQALANRMADYVVKRDKTANQEVLSYGLSLVLMAIASYATVLASAIIFGLVKEMLIAIGTFILMRTTVGGCHANNRVACLATYTGLLYASILLAGVIILNMYATIILYLFNIVLLVLYAPGDTVEQPMVQYRFLRKIYGLFFITLLFAFALFVPNMRAETNILLFVSTFVSILLHPMIYKLYGCRRSSNK